jgi:hypothetical protein
MVDMVAGHLGTNGMHGWTTWELGLSQQCLVRTEQALLGPFGASQPWLVMQESHRNRAVLRFHRNGHLSWDVDNEFDLDRWMRVDGFVWVIIDQFVHETSYLKPKLWWLMYWFCDILYAVTSLDWGVNLKTCVIIIFLWNYMDVWLI